MADSGIRQPRASEAVEKGVEGLYDFLFRLLNTVWLVIRHPSKAATALIQDRHRPVPRYVYPYTFAAVGVFLIALVAGVAGYNYLDWIWFYEEIQAKIVQELGQGVSLLTIAIGSVPAFVLMLGLAAIFAMLPHRRLHRARRALFVTCYAVGTQCILMFLAALLLSVAQAWPGGVDETAGAEFAAQAIGILAAIVLVVLLLAGIITPVLFISSVLNRGRPRGLARHATFLGAGVIMIGALFLLPVFASLPSRAASAVEPPSIPKLNLVSDAEIQPVEDGFDLLVDVTLSNPGHQTLAIASQSIEGRILVGRETLEKSGAKSLGLDLSEAQDEAGRPLEFNLVPPASVIWRRLRLHSGDGSAAAKNLMDQAASRCLEISMGQGADGAKTECVRTTFEVKANDPTLSAH